jgi:hypothetical protein
MARDTVLSSKNNPPFERMSPMAAMPDPADPGRDDDLAWPDEPDPEEEYCDYDLTAEELAEIRAAAADEVVAVAAATTGRRGPGQPGSARVFPGESASTAAGFGTGLALDVTPGCPQLAVAADAAAGGGDKDCFDGVADHELIGLLCAWDRLEAHMAARKLAVAAELFRRNPEEGFEPSAGAMPEVISDFEHNTPYEAGGRTCLCNGGPKCRYDHRLKQQAGWKVDQLADGIFRWTTPAGRSYDTEPTRYPI